jgi:tetratricopeptide (TPR) repeat protein
MQSSPRAAVLVGFLVPLGILACINISGTTLAGASKGVPGPSPANQLRRMLQMAPLEAYERLHFEVTGIALKDIEDEITEDALKAVEDMIRGRYDDSIITLEALEAKAPGNYSTAANLGTAYELKGDNRKALLWISEGIRRNPESHEGTEWLHELILQAKLKLEKEPDWLNHHHVLELDEAQIASPDYRLRVGNLNLPLDKIQIALRHQLTERMLLVKPKDPIVADLLHSYAMVEAHATVVESAIELMALSKEYGASGSMLIDSQLAGFEYAKSMGEFFFYLFCTGVIMTFVGGLYYCYRRKWFFLSIKDYRAYQAAQAEKR